MSLVCIRAICRSGARWANRSAGWISLGIPYTVTPGVPAFAAAAAALCRELTVPEVAQSVVLTRTSGRASAMPQSEALGMFAATRATLAIHLSVHAIERVVGELLPQYGAGCPAAVVWRASWPDQRIIESPLGAIAALVRAEALARTAVILVGRALDPGGFRDSALYSPGYDRRFRPSATAQTAQVTERKGVRPTRRP